jgi:phospholipid-binding lipoprotein MlaA
MGGCILQQYKLIIFATLTFLAIAITTVHAGTITDSDKADLEATSESQEYDDFDLEDEFEVESDAEVFDPLRGYNRFMTTINDKIYYWVLKPVARGYSIVMPESGRLAINRSFRNILFPVRLVNNLLQMKLKRGGIESARFGVNTTIGILGLRDPAKTWLNLDKYEEDFGQTLGHYGIGSGFHIVLPVLGPSNLRDTLGKVPDFFLNPINYVIDKRLVIAIKAYDKTNYTSLHIGEYESLQKDAIDFYTFMRDTYEQNRKMQIEE